MRWFLSSLGSSSIPDMDLSIFFKLTRSGVSLLVSAHEVAVALADAVAVAMAADDTSRWTWTEA